MTHAQWVWEFHALSLEQDRHNDEVKQIFKIASRSLIEILVAVLGLRFEHDEGENIKEMVSAKDMIPDDQIEPFVPFSLLVAPGERIDAAQKGASVEKQAERSLKEGTSFNQMSEAIASGYMDGDLAPFVDMIEGRISKDDYLRRDGIQEHIEKSEDPEDEIRTMMRSLGIEERPPDAPEAPHVSARPQKLADIDLFPEDWQGKR
jgi:hypothetical protein